MIYFRLSECWYLACTNSVIMTLCRKGTSCWTTSSWVMGVQNQNMALDSIMRFHIILESSILASKFLEGFYLKHCFQVKMDFVYCMPIPKLALISTSTFHQSLMKSSMKSLLCQKRNVRFQNVCTKIKLKEQPFWK